jgi:hypothetical protein
MVDFQLVGLVVDVKACQAASRSSILRSVLQALVSVGSGRFTSGEGSTYPWESMWMRDSRRDENSAKRSVFWGLEAKNMG